MRRLNTWLSIGALAFAGCVGDIGDDDGSVPDGPGPDATDFSCDPQAAALTPSPIKRLSKVYLENSVRELLSSMDEASRDQLMAELATRLDLIPADSSEHYSSNDESLAQDHVDAVFGLAVSLAAKVADESLPYGNALLGPCGEGADKSALADDACLTAFVGYYGRKAFRRPLTPAEVDDFKAFYAQATAEDVDGLGMLMGRFVAHPNFYYRFDSEGEELEGTEGEDAVYELSKWELLSKVTFLFWAGPPSDELYDRAESADLTRDDELTALIDDVLADPRAERGILSFYREWLLLDQTKMPATEGNVLAGQAMVAAAGLDGLPLTHRDDMIQEVLDLTKHYTLTTEGSLDDVFNSQRSFARTPALATIYGVERWDGSPEHDVELPAGQRSGLLTRAAFVASNGEYTRPVMKGKLIRTRILCQDIPPPPPDVNIVLLDRKADQTTREDFEAVTSGADCIGCHAQMNPLGFLSESYDPLGRYRTKELRFAEGTADVTGELAVDTRAAAGIDSEDTTELADATELGEHLAASEQAGSCMVLNYFEFGTGREPDPETDGCDLVGMREELGADKGSIKAMLRASVMLPSFRRRLIK
jgi:hypothetical protein